MEWAAAEGGDDPEEWECVACGKIFRSEAAWDSHERSKKHMKAVERLRSEMEEDEEEFGLGEWEVQNDGEDGDDKPSKLESIAELPAGSDLPLAAEPDDITTTSQGPSSVLHTAHAEEISPAKAKKVKKKEKHHSNLNSPEPLTKSEKKSRTLGDIAFSREESPPVASPRSEATPDGSQTELSKREKRHLREAKQVARQVSLYSPFVSSLVNLNPTCRHVMYARSNLRVKLNSSRTSMTQGMHLH